MHFQAQENNSSHSDFAVSLFGPEGLIPAQRPDADPRESLLRRAKELRELAARGMSKRAFTREAERLEAQAEAM